MGYSMIMSACSQKLISPRYKEEVKKTGKKGKLSWKLSKNKADAKKHGLSATKSAKLEIAKYFKRKYFIT